MPIPVTRATQAMLPQRQVARVVIGGGTGLIGRALTESLVRDGIAVDILTRGSGSASRGPDAASRQSARPSVRFVTWNPKDPGGLAALAGVLSGGDAVVNLTGVPVGPWPWTAGRRRTILASRVEPTQYLVAALASLAPQDRPATFVGASGIDGYMDIGAAPGTEATDIGATAGFLAEVGRAWEAAALDAEPLGIRVVTVRTAVVLGRDSALLPLLSLPVRLGLGGRYGSGDQWFSWVHLDDLVSAYRLAIEDPGVSGPLIASAPEPCRQRDFVAVMARVLRRPNWLPVPAWVLRLVLREEATLLLGSRRVVPERLMEAGFAFRFPELEGALRDALRRPMPSQRGGGAS